MAASSPDYPLAWTVPRNVRTFLADMAPLKVGERLRELRDARGLSQEDLASQIGVRARTISRWETGTTAGIYDHVEQLATALEVAPDEVVVRPRQPVEVSANDLLQLKGQLDRLEGKLNRVLEIIAPTAADDEQRTLPRPRSATPPPAEDPERPAEDPGESETGSEDTG